MVTFDDIKNSEKKKTAKFLKGSRDPDKIKHSLIRFYASIEENMANIISAKNIPIECCDGCSYCCLLKIDVRAHEIFFMADFIKSNFTADDISSLQGRLRNSANQIAPLTEQEHLMSNIPCGLLINNSCSVYSVRPSICRKCHSTSQETCIATYNHPTDKTITSAEDEQLDIAIRATIFGYDDGLKKSKLDVTSYEINKALLYALESPEHKKEWRKGKKAFPIDAEAK